MDRTLRLWELDTGSPSHSKTIAVLEGHEGSINAIASTDHSNVFVSGAADASIRVWKYETSATGVEVKNLQTVRLQPKFFPLSLALHCVNETSSSLVLAVAGTKTFIQIYVVEDSDKQELEFKLQSTLTGHEGWIRSLAFTAESNETGSDLLLSSASQDKYIRLWRIHKGDVLPAAAKRSPDDLLSKITSSFSTKAHRFAIDQSKYSISFEALLLGHDDWIYSVAWSPKSTGGLRLLSASADNSLAIWEPEEQSGVWVPTARLGQISAQKGSTTATGSTGGFWLGLWSPSAEQVVSLGRTGSWRSWIHNTQDDSWMQGIAVTGHVKAVTGIAWDPAGNYILSTSSDQTTRLHAQWKHDGSQSWHELARPQIHGYDLNCIDTLGSSRFISGADEKLLRVFDQPRVIAELLQRLCDINQSSTESMPEVASIPVLSLSNKAVDTDSSPVNGDQDENLEELEDLSKPRDAFDIDHPPFEDQLARHMLWPEQEKLYGHGYEISAVATSHDGRVVATACKASSNDHAVVRIYEAEHWREIKPPLKAHSLTITSLAFSDDDKYLLSVGRDRQWAVFQRSKEQSSTYTVASVNPKGHTRMILDAAWAPSSCGRLFATAGRDKSVKFWQGDQSSFECRKTLVLTSAVTAIAFLQATIEGTIIVATGEETGKVSVYAIASEDLSTSRSLVLDNTICPSKSITQLSWRPSNKALRNGSAPELEPSNKHELAVASEDSSLRIFSFEDLLYK